MAQNMTAYSAIIKKVIDVKINKIDNDISILLSFEDNVLMYDSGTLSVQFNINDEIYPSFYEEVLYLKKWIGDVKCRGCFKSVYYVTVSRVNFKHVLSFTI